MNYVDTKKTINEVIIPCDYFSITGDFEVCRLCSYKKLCEKVKDRVYKKEGSIRVKQNTSIRFERDGKIEVVKYEKPYELVVKGEELNYVGDNIERSSITAYNANIQAFEPVRDVFIIQNLRRSIQNSQKRSLQKFYDYILANDWHYFLTLTFSPEYVNRYDDEEISEKWHYFQKWIKVKNPNAKIIVCPERHEDGALHFHGFISNCPNIRLVPAYNSKTGLPLKNKHTGLPTLNLIDWKYGYSTVDVLPVENNYLRVCNYASKYITKNNDVGKNKKRYYHTKNLDCCNSENYFYSETEFSKLIEQYNLQPVKNSKGLTVFRGEVEY